MSVQQTQLGILTAPRAAADMHIPLRPYQNDAIDATLQAYDDGFKRTLMVLPTGCHRIGQGILMYNGTIRRVEDIAVGDVIMGNDSTPRNVLRLCRGRQQMVNIVPVKGQPFVVNMDHVLTLQRVESRSPQSGRSYPSTRGGGLVDVSVREYLGWSKTKKHLHKLVRSGASFPDRDVLFVIDPYMMGVILGDGSLTVDGRVGVTKPDPEIRDACFALASEVGDSIREGDSGGTRTMTYWFRGGHVVAALRNHVLLPIRSEDRFVPDVYKLGSRECRLSVLAGLLDTDGHLASNGFEYGSKSSRLARDVAFLARSLGLAAYVAERPSGVGAGQFRVSISGDVDCIPTRIPRKQAAPRTQKKSVLRTGFTVEVLAGEEDYYGFTLDGNNRYLLDDFTVTRNSGKTIIAAGLAGRMQERGCGRVLFIAHREELIFQTVEKMKMVLGRSIDIGIVKAEYNQPNANIVVASVQTIQNSQRMSQLGQFGLVIPDEAHHATAESWMKVLDAAGVNDPDGPYVSGMTATPDRTDGAGLKAVFEKIVYETGIFAMIDQGYLVDIQAKSVLIDVDFSRIRVSHGEFNAGDAGRELMRSQAPRVIAAAIREHASARQSIVFVPTVEVAHATAIALNDVDIVATALDANTPSEERRGIMARMHDGTLRAVVNVGVLSEGTDIPSVDCIVMAQPTKSRSRYTQMIGRGLRPHIGKENALVLDLVGVVEQHRLQTVATLFGIDPVRLEKETVRKAKLLQEIELEAFNGKVVVRDIEELAGRKMHWTTTLTGDYVLAAPPDMVMLRFAGETAWGEPNWQVWNASGQARPVMVANNLTLDYAQGVAEDMARKLQGTVTSALTKLNAPWRSEPVTQKQLGRMWYMKIPTDGIKTKGQAADAMNAAEAMQRLKDLSAGG